MNDTVAVETEIIFDLDKYWSTDLDNFFNLTCKTWFFFFTFLVFNIVYFFLNTTQALAQINIIQYHYCIYKKASLFSGYPSSL